jgi:hypothetical protein
MGDGGVSICKHASESFPGVADADGTSMDIERPRWPLATASDID